MARPKTTTLTYFPFDVDFFEDDKIQLIEAEFGIKGVFITVKLLCKIYKENGYFYQWGDDQCLLFAKNAGNGIVSNLVQEVVNGLIKRSFLDKEMYDSFNILTSKAIQNRFIKALERSKEIVIIKEYACKGVLIPVNVTLIPVNATLIPQIKEDQIKEENPPLPPKGDEIEIPPVWKKDFKVYLEDLRNDYKRITAEKDWISQQEKFNPGVDIQKSIEKSCVNYWATEAGWKKKKGSKIKSIDWKSTFANAVSQPMNRVYKDRLNSATEPEIRNEPYKPEKW